MALSFPNPKCELEGCPRRGQNMWRSTAYSLALNNGSGMVEIITFSCRPDKPHSRHYAYRTSDGEVAENLGAGRGCAGRYRWRDSATGEMHETKSGHADAMASPELRKRLGALVKRRWKNPAYRGRMTEIIRKQNQYPQRREKISAAMQLRAQDPDYIEQQRQRTLASWQDPKIARRRIKGTKKAMADPEVKKRVKKQQSEASLAMWARRTATQKALLDAAKTSLPADWKKKRRTWWIAGMMLLQQEDYMSNEEVAVRLDELIRCPYGATWLGYFTDRAGVVFVNRIRNWVHRPGLEK